MNEIQKAEFDPLDDHTRKEPTLLRWYRDATKGIPAHEIFPVVVAAAVVVVIAGELVRRRLHHLVEPAAKRLERLQRVSPGLFVARPGGSLA